jgi:hypothetical protein
MSVSDSTEKEFVDDKRFEDGGLARERLEGGHVMTGDGGGCATVVDHRGRCREEMPVDLLVKNESLVIACSSCAFVSTSSSASFFF